MVLFATLLATPCTAPFLGSAVGFAISQDSLTILLIFLSMGIGFGFPYIALLLIPKRFHFIPKPGKWMILIKKICAVLLFITAIWLIWILISLTNIEISLILAISCFLLTLYFSKFKKKLILIIISLSLLMISITYFSFEEKELTWHPFDQQQIQKQLNNGRPVFIDITAKWCITCQVNKLKTLNNRDVINVLIKNNVYLMRADWTNNNKKITKFIKIFKRAGVPLNILYKSKNTKPIVFSEIISKDDLINHFDN